MSFIASICEWHEKLFKNSLFTQKVTGLTIIFAVILGIIASYMNFQARHINWEIWEENKSEFFFEDTPLFTTMDAGIWLGVAGYLKTNRTMEDFQSLRSYPKNKTRIQHHDNVKLSTPLLSRIIAFFAKDESPQALLTAANRMIPYTALITAVAVIFAFGITGYWMEASVAAAGGGLSISVYWRTSMGRIDTDQLNIAFMYFMFALVLCAGRAKDIKWGLFFTLIAGLTANIFMSWYGKSELILMALISLIWLLIVITRDWRRVIGFSALFILLSGVEFLNPFNSVYLKTELYTGKFIFNNVISTVTEAIRLDIRESLYRLTGSVFLGVICIIGILIWAVRHPVIAVAYGPLAGFAILNLFIGNRAGMYSAPFFWFGGAYLAVLSVKFVVNHFSLKLGNLTQNVNIISSATVCALLLSFVWMKGPINQVKEPSIPVAIIKAMSEMKSIVGQEEGVMASWWDYGYASMFFNGLPTFTDPGQHQNYINYFIADALLSNNQSQSADTLRFLARGGLLEKRVNVANLANRAELYQKIRDGRNLPSPTVYLMLTDQMTGWMSSISKIGRWDIDLGVPIVAKGHKPGQQLTYNFLNCVDTKTKGILECNNSIVNLNEGKINGNPVLNLVAEARGGRLVGSKGYRKSELNMFQIMRDSQGQSAKVAIIHRDLFFSTFNQMFHLGRYDIKNFKLVYDGYPNVRIFKLLPVSE